MFDSPQSRMKNPSRFKWTVATIAALAVVAFFTNPSQATHRQVLGETVRLRHPGTASWQSILPAVSYHNYIVFSTTSAPNLNEKDRMVEDTTATYGFFGSVRTTNFVRMFMTSN
jgi:hypothetical protein